MDSKYSFGYNPTHTLIKDVFREYIDTTDHQSTLLEVRNHYILQTNGKKDIIFGTEDDVVEYFRKETKEHIKNSKM